MILGVLTGEYSTSLNYILPGFGLCIVTLWSYGLPKRHLLAAIILTIGAWANHRLHTSIVSKTDLRLIIGNQPRLVTLIGTVGSLPQSRAAETKEETVFRTQVMIDADHVEIGNRRISVTGRVIAQINQKLPGKLDPGSVVSIRGCIKHPDRPLVPGAFDYRRYLRNRGIHYQIQLPQWEPDFKIVSHPRRRPFPAVFQDWARETLALGHLEENTEIRLIWAMVMGYRMWLSGERKEPFMLSGTLHVFAISGLHIAMIASFMVILSKTCRIPRRHAGLLVIPALWFYTAATGYPASAIRASTVSSIVLLGWILGRPPEVLNSLGIAVMLLLIWEPLQLFQPGFQLSFTVVTSLILLFPKLNAIALRIIPNNSMTPAQSQSVVQRLTIRMLHKIVAGVSVSLAAWIGSVPLVAMFFNLITPVSIATNLILIPIASLTMASAFMSLVTAPLLPAIAELANSSTWFWMKAMIWLCKTAASLPGAHFTVSHPPVPWCLLYYGILLIWALSPSKNITLTTICIGLITALGLAYNSHLRSQNQTTITFLPIPNADAILIDAPGKSSDVLIDGGPLWSSKRALEPFLATIPHTAKITKFLLTHGDKQHVEVLPYLMKDREPGPILTSPLRFRSSFYRQLINDLDTQGYQMKQIAAPQRIGDWQVLHPYTTSPASPADDAPLVLLGNLYGQRILLLSDLDRGAQKEILNHKPTLEVDVLSLNLPAKLTPPNIHVIQQLTPQVIIVTGSETAKGARWVESLRRQLNELRTRVLFTGTDGTIVLSIKQSEATISTQSSQPFKLRQRFE